jgi:hypothetical protein
MAERGLAAPPPPATAYEPIWCAWGYEREFSVPLVVGTLTKVKELGLQWAVLDDGWQQTHRRLAARPAKFAGGDAGMKAFVDAIHAQGLKARLWIAPLAVAPGQRRAARPHRHAAARQGRRAAGGELVELLLPLPGPTRRRSSARATSSAA